MAEFADVLADVMAATSLSAAPPSSAFHFQSPAAEPHPAVKESDARLRSVAAAYREALEYNPPSTPTCGGGPGEIDNAVARESMSFFSREFARARHSPPMLRRLRRRMAWALHPDRANGGEAEASQAMARFNAMIDAEISRCGKR